MNGFVVVGSLLSLVDHMTVICIGKFLFGVAAGGMTVYCPNYINEAAPTEMKGPAGAVCQLAFCFGIFLPAIFGLAIPDDVKGELDSFYIQQYWRVIWGFPALIAIIQSLLLWTVFPYDTPVETKQKGGNLDEFMKRMYTEEAIDSRTKAFD